MLRVQQGFARSACAPADAMQASNRRRRLLASRSAGHLGLHFPPCRIRFCRAAFMLRVQQGFARLRAGRVAALTCHWHVIHYRSHRIPAYTISKIFPPAFGRGGIFLVLQQGFARLRAGRVAALTCHWHVIHYRSHRIPAYTISKIFPLPLAGGIFLVLQQGFEPWTPALKGRCSTC